MSSAHKEHLVGPERLDVTEAPGVVDQGRSTGDDRVVHCVPVAAECLGDLADAPPPPADLERRPPPGSIGHRHPGCSDATVLLSPAALGAGALRAAPPALAPSEPRRTPERGQVHKLDVSSSLADGDRAALSAPDEACPRLDLDQQRIGRDAVDTDLGQPDEQLAHGNSVAFHGGSPLYVASSTNQIGRASAFAEEEMS